MSDREARLDALKAEALHAVASPGPSVGYYGQPVLKRPVWTWEVPIYFFVGGAAGAAAMIAATAGPVAGQQELARHAHWIAFAGAVASVPLLVADLGRPSRFLNMLRVFKRQSPMSVGAWTLALFGPFAALSLATDYLQMSIATALASGVAGLLGLILMTYTGVLIGATAVPVWSRHARILPWHFGASALGAAVSLVELTGTRTLSLNLIGIAAAASETAIGVFLERRRRTAARSLFAGRAGVVTRTGGLISGPIPLILRLALASSPAGRAAAALLTIAGSITTRVAWMIAGRHSAMTAREE